jgi:hypothetical protein
MDSSLFHEVDLSDDDFDEQEDYITDFNFRICPPKASYVTFGLNENRQFSQSYYKEPATQIYRQSLGSVSQSNSNYYILPPKIHFPLTTPTTTAPIADHTVPKENVRTPTYPPFQIPPNFPTSNAFTSETTPQPPLSFPQVVTPFSIPTATNVPPLEVIPQVHLSTIVPPISVTPSSPTLPVSPSIYAQTVPALTIPVPSSPHLSPLYSPPIRNIDEPAASTTFSPTLLAPTLPTPTLPAPITPAPTAATVQATPLQTIPSPTTLALNTTISPALSAPTPQAAPTPALTSPVSPVAQVVPVKDSMVPAHFTGANKVCQPHNSFSNFL